MRVLHLDIETAPIKAFCWGLWDQRIALNQIVEPGYTLCWAAKWHGKRKVYFNSVHQSSTEEMIKEIHTLIGEADAVCHYNGKKFDIPTLQGEMAQMGLSPPAPYKQIDLLQTARRQFRLTSNKLDWVAQRFGIGGKVEHKGMDLWKGCMDGDNASWKVMKRYNIQDVRLLEALYEKLLPWIVNHPIRTMFGEGGDCPRCGGTHLQSRGESVTTTVVYKRFQCQDCGAWSKRRLSEKSPKPEFVPAK